MGTYFVGTRTNGPHTYKSGKVSIAYTVTESWRNTGRSQTVRCGVAGVMTRTHEVGIELIQLEIFGSKIEGTIGVNALASLKGHVEENTQSTIKWTSKVTATDSFTIPGKPCGRQTTSLYQMVRDYRFVVEEPRLIRKPRVSSFELHELTGMYDMRVESDEDEPGCPCPKRTDPKPNEVLALNFGRLSLRVDAVKDDKGGFSFSIGRYSYSIARGVLSYQPTLYAFTDLPESIRAFSESESDSVTAYVSIVKDFQVSDLQPETLLSPVVAVAARAIQSEGEATAF